MRKKIKRCAKDIVANNRLTAVCMALIVCLFHLLCAVFEETAIFISGNKITSAALITHGGVIMQLLSRFGYPKNEPREWVTSFGEGYTVTVTPQFWMRDKIFEITGAVPMSKTDDFDFNSQEDDYDWRKDV